MELPNDDKLYWTTSADQYEALLAAMGTLGRPLLRAEMCIVTNGESHGIHTLEDLRSHVKVRQLQLPYTRMRPVQIVDYLLASGEKILRDENNGSWQPRLLDVTERDYLRAKLVDLFVVDFLSTAPDGKASQVKETLRKHYLAASGFVMSMLGEGRDGPVHLTWASVLDAAQATLVRAHVNPHHVNHRTRS